MSFYSYLDDEGKKLYDAYIKASDEWSEYCRPKVFANFNDYLNKTNRKFNRYEFYTQKYNDKKNDDEINDDINDEKNDENDENDDINDIKKIYKFLSKKLHPDRFKKNNSDKFFAMINKANHLGNETFLNFILDKIDLITNFTDDEFDNFFANLNKKSLSSIDDELFNSIQYKLFCEPSYKKYINDMFITEEEIIKEIENTYDYSFVEFYFNRYKDNDNIKKACVIKMEKEREKLLEENKSLKKEIEDKKKLYEKLFE